jgi:YidC/Oxa1 family membrane protein insertase
MDKNSIIGVVLIAAIIGVFMWWSQPSAEQIAQQKAQRDSLAMVELTRQAEEKAALIADSTKAITQPDSAALASQYGVFANVAKGENSFVTLENKLIKLTLSSKGGRVYSVELKDYKTFDNQPLVIFNGDHNKFGFTFTHNNRVYNTNDLYFEVTKQTGNSAEFRLKGGDDNYLAFNYQLPENSYMVDFSMTPHQMGEIIGKNQASLDLNWELDLPRLEKSRKNEIANSGIYFKYFQDEVDWMKGTKSDTKDLRTKLQWVAFKDQFFSSVFIAKKPLLSANVRTVAIEDANNKNCRSNQAQIAVPFDGTKNESVDFNFYFGPNHYLTLKKQGEELELNRLVHLGWGILGWINRFAVIPIFNFLQNYISSYGLIILLLTLIIKVVLYPLTYKSYLSTAKMKVLKPQVDEINAKIPKEKPMERQQAMMALYKKAGVNPMGGCLPMLLQFPILIAIFNFFPSSIELRHQSFLWASDLSSYDSIFNLPFTIPFYGDHVSLFCLLMTITNLVYTWMNQEMTQSSQTMPGMKTMMYIMPVMFLFFFNDSASGLSYYYFISTLFTIGQTLMMRRFVNEEALLAKIHANQKKPVQKSKFQQRLEEMAKQQQAAAKRKK